MQPFNRSLLRASIGLILLSCLLFITNTHSRRKYYVGNYVAVGLNVVANCAVAFWAHQEIAAYKAWYLENVDFAQLARRLSRVGTYTESTFWFDIHIAVFALTLIVSLLLLINVCLKLKVMGDEKRLLEAGKAVSA
jgi:hypothetical protein